MSGNPKQEMAATDSAGATNVNSDESQRVSKAQVDAILVLIKAVHLGQSRGCYSLDEAKSLSEACAQFIVKQDGVSNTNPLADIGQVKSPQQPDFSKLRVDS